VSNPRVVRRVAADACPGALRLHLAADGPLARVRLPGGLLTGAQLGAVRELAERWGDGHVELTSRANLQLRGLTGAPPAELAARLWAAGLLPSQTHELVRNIAASPLAAPARRAVVAELDDRLCADPELAALPGRFLFALDDGSGDVAAAADVAAFPDGDRSAILFAGEDAGLRVASNDVVSALLAAAHAFLDERAGEPAWRVRELADGPARVAARTAAALGVRLEAPARLEAPGPWPVSLEREDGRTPRERDTIGIVAQPDGLVCVAALVPLGRLGAVAMEVLQEAELLVVTPSRGVVVPDLPASAAQEWLRWLADAGLEVAAGSPWSGVTSCAGRPGCGKALADVRRDAEAVVRGGGGSDGRLLPVHWVGCARGCGSPGGEHVRVEATEDEYQVTAPASATPVSAARPTEFGLNHPGIGQAGIGQAGIGQAGIGQAGIGQAGIGQAGIGQAGIGQAGIGQAGIGQAGIGQAGIGQAEIGEVVAAARRKRNQ
jgi:precorrin-3B synthase